MGVHSILHIKRMERHVLQLLDIGQRNADQIELNLRLKVEASLPIDCQVIRLIIQ